MREFRVQYVPCHRSWNWSSPPHAPVRPSRKTSCSRCVERWAIEEAPSSLPGALPGSWFDIRPDLIPLIVHLYCPRLFFVTEHYVPPPAQVGLSWGDVGCFEAFRSGAVHKRKYLVECCAGTEARVQSAHHKTTLRGCKKDIIMVVKFVAACGKKRKPLRRGRDGVNLTNDGSLTHHEQRGEARLTRSETMTVTITIYLEVPVVKSPSSCS